MTPQFRHIGQQASTRAGSSTAHKALKGFWWSYTLGGRSSTNGLLEGTATSEVGKINELSVARNNIGGRGDIPGEQHKQRSSGRSLVTICADTWLDPIPCRDGYKRIVRMVEAQLLKTALAEAEGNKLKAAGLLGIQRRLLYEKMREHGLR